MVEPNNYVFPWDTTTTLLKYNGNKIVLKGISLTGTEYISSLYPFNTYYDFRNMCITKNFVTMINSLVQIPNNPIFRIPLNADYLLEGSAQAPPDYSFNSEFKYGANIQFTGEQYQQSIIDMIYAVTCPQNTTITVSTVNVDNYTSNSNPTIEMSISGVSNASIILDLHWNYGTVTPQQSKNGTNGNDYLSGQQLFLPGCFLTNGSNTGTIQDNTLDFWTTITQMFGIDNTGTPIYSYTTGPMFSVPISSLQKLNNSIFANIFFELYNEPVSDQLTTSPNVGPGQTYSGSTTDVVPYLNNYTAFLYGGEYYTQYSQNKYNFTGFIDMYNTIRNLKAVNVCIVNGSDIYGFMNISVVSPTTNPSQPGQFDYSQGGSNAGNTIVDTYNCFTTFRNTLGESFYNVMFGLHPYSGLFSGATKGPGLYNVTGSLGQHNSIPFTGQILECLQNRSTIPYNQFSVSNPLICTEFGSFDLPWGGYYGETDSDYVGISGYLDYNKTNTVTYTSKNQNPLAYAYNVPGGELYGYPYNGTDQMEIDGVTYTNPNPSYNNPPNNAVNYTVALGAPLYNGTWISPGYTGSDGVSHERGEVVVGPALIGMMQDFATFNVSHSLWGWRPNSGGNGNSNDCQGYRYGWAGSQPDVAAGCYSYSGNYVTDTCGPGESQLISFVNSSIQTQTQFPTMFYPISNAEDITIGKNYQIFSLGTTNFTKIGAPNNNIGTCFTATDIGSGTGTVNGVVVWANGSLSATPPSTIPATNILNDNTYTIAIIGSTDFTTVGAAAPAYIGQTFVATGTPSGSGTVIPLSTYNGADFGYIFNKYLINP